MPVLFGFIGGVLAYLGVKDEDEDVAKSLLWIGIGVTLLWVVLILASVWPISRRLTAYPSGKAKISQRRYIDWDQESRC